MRKTALISILCLAALIVICPVYQKFLNKKRFGLLTESKMGYFIPSEFTAPASFEFKGIVSDFLYLKVSTFIGGKLINKEMLNSEDAGQFYKAAQIITDLDPWFWDAYLINSMILAWDFGKVDLACTLLKKATEYRTWDSNPPYYLGFYYYYFKKDNARAADYLMEAARRGGGHGFLVPLATRLATYQNQLRPAIMLLEEQLKTIHDPVMAGMLKKRLEVLIILEALEKKVGEYKSRYGHLPENINELVSKQLIARIPKDPYGGNFYITKNGRVYTTSEMRFSKNEDKKSN